MTTAAVLQKLESKGFKLAIAESLTGGALSAEFISNPGASKVVLGSIVAYQSVLKNQLLGVSNSLLESLGAVNAEVAAQMAGGVRTKLANKSDIDEALVIGLATTGVAGPDVQDSISVGTVFVAISAPAPIGDLVYAFEFDGERNSIRAQAVAAAIDALGECLAD